MKRKRKKRPHKQTDTLYKIIFGITFAIEIVSILLFYEGIITKLFYANKNYYFVESSTSAFLAFCFMIVFHLVLLVVLYDKVVVKKIPLKLFNNKILKKSCILKLIVVIFITAIALVYSLSNISYINDTVYYDGQTYTNLNEIKSAHIYAKKDIISLPKSSPSYRYLIVCELEFNSSSLNCYSSNFYGYKSMYLFLKSIDDGLIRVEQSEFNNLIEYEKESLRMISEIQVKENVSFIEKIMQLDQSK